MNIFHLFINFFPNSSRNVALIMRTKRIRKHLPSSRIIAPGERELSVQIKKHTAQKRKAISDWLKVFLIEIFLDGSRLFADEAEIGLFLKGAWFFVRGRQTKVILQF